MHHHIVTDPLRNTQRGLAKLITFHPTAVLLTYNSSSPWHRIASRDIASNDVTTTSPDPATDIETSKHLTSKHKTSPPWNSRKLVHSKGVVWAWRWPVALRTFYRQILSLLYIYFFFWNFRPRLARELLVWSLFLYVCIMYLMYIYIYYTYMYIYYIFVYICNWGNFVRRFRGDHSTSHLSGAARCPCITWHKLIALLRRWVFCRSFQQEVRERFFFMVARAYTPYVYLYIVNLDAPKLTWNPNDLCFDWTRPLCWRENTTKIEDIRGNQLYTAPPKSFTARILRWTMVKLQGCLRKFQQTPKGTCPRYPKMHKYERVLLEKSVVIGVWGMFQGYVGAFLEVDFPIPILCKRDLQNQWGFILAS